MTRDSLFVRAYAFLALITLLIFWSSMPFAAPVVGPLRSDEVAVADRLLNEILHAGSKDRADTTERAGAEKSDMVVELMNAAHWEVFAALQKAKIAGEVKVRSGTFLSGFMPPRSPDDVSGSRHINLLIYQNGNKLGDLAVGKSYAGSTVTPFAEFTRVQ
ncbi:MAG TPA: hypothetical protein VGJ20_36590 [Xanthobacteraceae bacterium]|jgi:hypothetical protein